MTIGGPPRAARVRLPPRPPQTPRQRQQRQPRPLFDNLTTPPAQRHHGPQKDQRRRARLTGAPATATAATGAARTATAARTTRNLSRAASASHAPPVRATQGARPDHYQPHRHKARKRTASTRQGTRPRYNTSRNLQRRQRPRNRPRRARFAPRPARPPQGGPHWTPATTANAGTAAQALPILKAQTDHTEQRPDES